MRIRYTHRNATLVVLQAKNNDNRFYVCCRSPNIKALAMMASRRSKIIKRLNINQRQGLGKTRKLIRCIVVLPSLYLLLERAFLFPFEDSNLTVYLDVERVAATTTIKKTKVAPTVVFSSTITPEKTRKSLEALTQPFRVTDTSSLRCPAKTTKSIAGYDHLEVTTTEARTKPSTGPRRQKMPKIMHQQGTSRCVPSALYDLNEEWKTQLSNDKGEGDDAWSMYYHTEDAMTRLFRAIIAVQGEEEHSKHSIPSMIGTEFPHLRQILRNCVNNGSFAKRLLWRFLCLYIYGGMYVDLECALPPNYHGNAKTILQDSYDTVLLWVTNEDNLEESDRPKKNFCEVEGGINPNIMAVSPGHPLMYYAVHYALLQVTAEEEVVDNELNKSAQNSVVSNILKHALANFLREHNLDSKLVHRDKHTNSSSKITYSGTGNTTVTIIDSSRMIEGTKTTSEVEFFQITELMKEKRLSSFEPEAFGGRGGTGLGKILRNPSSCLRKVLADASTTT